jgi:hypothetical protein
LCFETDQDALTLSSHHFVTASSLSCPHILTLSHPRALNLFSHSSIHILMSSHTHVLLLMFSHPHIHPFSSSHHHVLDIMSSHVLISKLIFSYSCASKSSSSYQFVLTYSHSDYHIFTSSCPSQPSFSLALFVKRCGIPCGECSFRSWNSRTNECTRNFLFLMQGKC